MLRSAGNQIECAFGRLIARFLGRKVGLKFESIPTVVYFCFVQHNYCENKYCGLNENEVRLQIQHLLDDENENPNVPNRVNSHDNCEGEFVCSVLTEKLHIICQITTMNKICGHYLL